MTAIRILPRQRWLSPWQPVKGGKGGWGRETESLKTTLDRDCVGGNRSLTPYYPRDAHILIPRICKCNLLWQRSQHMADVITLRVLSWGDNPGLSGWALNHRSPSKRENEGEHTEEIVTWRQTETEMMQLLAKECQQPPEGGRSKKLTFLKSFWWESDPANTLILAQWNQFQVSALQDHKKINFCHFKLPTLWVICYNSHRKLIQTGSLKSYIASTNSVHCPNINSNF